MYGLKLRNRVQFQLYAITTRLIPTLFDIFSTQHGIRIQSSATFASEDKNILALNPGNICL